MPSTQVSLHYHLVFSTRGRRRWINAHWEDRLYSYLGGVIKGLHGMPEEINGVADHVHILASLDTTRGLADVMREIKASSSQWVHRVIGNRLFSWQDGYGAFTVSCSQIEIVKNYIQNQKNHHQKRTFQDEYRNLLQLSGIEFDEKYLW